MPKKPTMVFVTLTDVEKEAIAKEIDNGTRPKHWADPSHPDYKVWQMMLTVYITAGITVRI